MRRVLTLYSLLLIFSSVLSPVIAQQDAFIHDYLERLENSRKYLILIAETMPKDKYSFKVTPEASTFAEHLMHIAWAMDWHSQSLLGGREARDWETDTELRVRLKSKEEMIAAVNTTFDRTIALIEQFDVAKLDAKLDYFGLARTKRQILLLLADHISHHRGQMLVYMRINGYKPPRYVLFQ
ncbi:MAG: DinB family protein [Bacteroidota bacterium]